MKDLAPAAVSPFTEFDVVERVVLKLLWSVAEKKLVNPNALITLLVSEVKDTGVNMHWKPKHSDMQTH